MTDQFDRFFLHARDSWRPRILANAARPGRSVRRRWHRTTGRPDKGALIEMTSHPQPQTAPTSRVAGDVRPFRIHIPDVDLDDREDPDATSDRHR